MGGSSATPAVTQYNFTIYYENKFIPKDSLGRPKTLTDAINVHGVRTILKGIEVCDTLINVGFKVIKIRPTCKSQYAANYRVLFDEYTKTTGIYYNTNALKLHDMCEFHWNLLKDWDEYWEDSLYV